jgi:hypothetical protein
MDLLADELDYPNRAAQLAKRRTDRVSSARRSPL